MTPDGVLYEKEAILDCLLSQKQDYARKLALYEAQLADERRTADAAGRAAEEARLEQFHRMNHGGGALPSAGGGAGGGGGGASGGAGGASAGASSVAATAFQAEQARGMKAFWMPGQTPEAASLLAKPSSDTLCPSTGKKLRMKDLTPVRFTRIPGDEPESGFRYMCPTCKEARACGRSVCCCAALTQRAARARRRSPTCRAWWCSSPRAMRCARSATRASWSRRVRGAAWSTATAQPCVCALR